MSREENLFVDQGRMYRAFKNEKGEMGIAVLCGGIGMYEVKLLLTDEERQAYEERGRHYLDDLARDVARNLKKYENRTFG